MRRNWRCPSSTFRRATRAWPAPNVAIGDNNTTGSFLGQKFTLDVTEVKPDADVVPAFKEMVARGDRYVLADISARQLLSIADIARDNGVLIFNVGATDDILREEECRVNVFHTAPTRTMLADGLAQYLIWKQWRRLGADLRLA